VGGGAENTASGYAATVCGGQLNTASGWGATAVGGTSLNADGDYATVGGGYSNGASAGYAAVGGGGGNTASARAATVSGGADNTASDDYATLGGGAFNTASGSSATVGGGYANTASGNHATVGGGNSNVAGVGDYATVGGGFDNTASGAFATVVGGDTNTASGFRGTVVGGVGNVAGGSHSLAAGRRAKANNQGCFVWGDAIDANIPCDDDNRTIFRSTGGFYIYTKSDLTKGVYLAPNDTSWQPVPGAPSDRKLKQDVVPIDAQHLLQTVAALPLSTWSYHVTPDVRHIGPMAQDFYAAFGLGEDDEHIDYLDASGVALAAIQGLHAQNEQLEGENVELRGRVDDLESRLEALEQAAATGREGEGETRGTVGFLPLRALGQLPAAFLVGLMVALGLVIHRRSGGGAP
jgi:hypothetical protein